MRHVNFRGRSLDVRRVEDENVHGAMQAREKRLREVGEDGVEQDGVGEGGEAGTVRCVRV